MTQHHVGARAGARAVTGLAIAAALTGIGAATSAIAQEGFQIVWVAVGEAATSDDSGNARAGRRLFDAGDLASLSLDKVRIVRIEAEPVITDIDVGEEWCVSSLEMRAFGPDQKLVPSAPVTVTVRQDHREEIRLRRSRKDICLRPTTAGEYPLRFTSLLPAPDGSMRGAQVFVRVAERSDQALGTRH